MKFLKQSTASQSVLLGPFVDDTDGTTAETGLTIANTDIRLSKAGANIAAKNSGGGTHDELGYYTITLDATDTDTVGILQVICKMTGALIVEDTFQVLEEAVYDDLFAASAAGYAGITELATVDSNVDAILVDTAEIGAAGAGLTALATQASVDTIDGIVDAILVDTGTTLDTKLNDMQGATFNTSTDSLEAIRNRGDAAWTGSAITSDSGTAQAGAAGSITLQAGASATDNIYNGQVVYISSGTGAGQSRAIDGYTGSSKVATVITNWVVTPDATSVYEIYPDDITEVTAAPTAAAVADAVWDENTTGHTTAGTFGEQCKNDIDAILVDTGTTLDGKIDTVDANVDAILVDTAEIGAAGAGLTALASQASLDTVDGIVDTILVDTGTTVPAQIAALNNLSAAQVNAECDTAISDAALATAAALATVDTEVGQIKTKTDQMIFTKTNELDTNALSIAGVTITGDGNATPFDVV